ncbi:flagellar assembly protein J [Methanoculleus chikugoensis]|uniref:Flagellar assembly protein J n=1 Tax=Methanoculleus chikugoensis TaxID=118126 RepID=A0A1M4MK35_9EURY|nr:archaellar assembly protein FlaJ [Methanoculleus chikugoensis]NMA10782.1 archaellar assembly protein FlaJ [Methanomicrobiales archaeon]SCL75207.1 flagellar assembly protein J [Methanoculleus chikugoensis]
MFEDVTERLRAANQGKIPFEEQAAALADLRSTILENKKMEQDLLLMYTYMAAITTSTVTRPEIFQYTAERFEYIPSRYIAKVQRLVAKWGQNYSSALRAIAERCRNATLQSMLNRYANSIDSGVPDDDFINTELSSIRSIYRNSFEQGIELLKKWGDAYIAMLLSGALVAIIMMISVAIYAPDGIEATLNTSYFIILAISIFGLTIMYRAVPDDPRTHGLSEICSREQGLIRRLERLILPITAAIGLMLILVGANAGIIFLLVGLLLMPLGVIGYIDDANVVNRDNDFATFIRGLGSIMGGKGITTGDALQEVDRKSLFHLEPFINSVSSKLNLGLDEAGSWKKFIGETGSYLIYKYMNIFRDAVALGGSPDAIGKIVSSSMLEQVLLRRKRDMMVKGFVVLLVPMHGAMISIFVFLFEILLAMSRAVTEVMTRFTETSAALSGGSASIGSSMGASLNIFANFPEDTMRTYVVTILLMLTVANVLAGKIVMGGDRYLYYFFTSLLCVVTGVVYIIAPIVVGALFIIPTFTGV